MFLSRLLYSLLMGVLTWVPNYIFLGICELPHEWWSAGATILSLLFAIVVFAREGLREKDSHQPKGDPHMWYLVIDVAVNAQRLLRKRGWKFRSHVISRFFERRVIQVFGCSLSELNQTRLDEVLQGHTETCMYFFSIQNASKDKSRGAYQIAQAKKEFWHAYMLVAWFDQHRLREGIRQYHYGE